MGRKYNLEARLESNRPPVTAGRLDQRLAGLARALRGVVAETQETFIYPAWQLDNDALDELAVVLVEFAEDIHAGIGLWQALENYQSEFFGTPLPLSSRWASRSREGLIHAACGISFTFCGGN